MSDPAWGERRAATRQRTRSLWIACIVLFLAASPFLLGAAALHYHNSGGIMPDGRFPLWIPIAYWIIVATVALIGVIRLHHASDEFERRRLIEGFAVSGLILGLSIPPVFFLGYQFDIMYSWIVAFLAGLLVFFRPRGTA